MTIYEWLEQAQKKISRLDAELILIDNLGVSDRSYLIAHENDAIADATGINHKVERRTNHEPLAYILGYRWFYGRKFIITPDVLIPRPETETIIDIAKEMRPTKILDIGTGSGCIAITLTLELKNANITAIDISEKALNVARKNAELYDAKINFIQSDLLDNFTPEPNTLIIANLPYVDKNWDWLEQESLSYEPSLALFAGNNGLELIYKLFDQAPSDSQIIIESDLSQQEKIIEYAANKKRNLIKKEGYITVFDTLKSE